MRQGRLTSFLMVGAFVLFIFWMLGSMFGDHSGVISHTNPPQRSTAGTSGTAQGGQQTLPWDYRVEKATVGDRIGGDMTILPSEQLLPNDNNYATGDTIWVLDYMNAQMNVQANGADDITLSSWKAIKSYKSEAEANQDMANLKQEITTQVNLVGVYKTEYQGKYREFAVLTLPSGNAIKQPIDEARYAKYKTQKKVSVNLEEVHDYANYDQAFAKFRGWAD